MSTAPVLLEVKDDVAVLTLNRPDKLNAITVAMHKALKAALKDIKKAKARAVIVTGAGRAFCAGQDLADPDLPKLDPPDLGLVLEEYYNPFLLALRALPVPVIAAVNGVAAGAGVGVALAADITFAARGASFIQAFVNIAVVPDAGNSHILPRLIGNQRAMGLLMTGDPIDAETAAQWGLIWKAVDDEALMDEVGAFAARMANQPTRILGLIKRQVYSAAQNGYADQLILERQMQKIAGLGNDYREGIKAFLEKRPARFTGN